jgi:hypothetical protein
MAKYIAVSSLTGIVFGVLLFLFLTLFASNFRYSDGPQTAPFAGDFIQEYVGGYIVLYGDRSHFYDIDREHPENSYVYKLEHDPEIAGFQWQPGPWFPMIYPPFYYLLVSPLNCFPIYTAALIWLGLMIAAFIASMLLLAWHYPERTILLWAMPAGALFLLLVQTLTMSQKGTLLLLILTTTFVLLDRRRAFWAGLVFGLITFKPHLALVIGLAMLCKRQWQFVAGSVLTTSVLICLCFVIGPDVANQYFQVSLRMGQYSEMPGYQFKEMHSWFGFFRLLLPSAPLQVVWIATAITWSVTIALLARILWGPLAFGQPLFAIQYSGLVLATILISPHLMTYDLTPLLLPMILLIIQVTSPDTLCAGQARTVLWMLASLYVLAGISSSLVPYIYVQLSVLLMFGLLVMLSQMTTCKPAATVAA